VKTTNVKGDTADDLSDNSDDDDKLEASIMIINNKIGNKNNTYKGRIYNYDNDI
jgi:hypothetical protein